MSPLTTLLTIPAVFLTGMALGALAHAAWGRAITAWMTSDGQG